MTLIEELAVAVDPAWTKPTVIPLDRDGPTAVPFERPQVDFVERSIYDLFEHIATAHGLRPALGNGIDRLTYAEVRAAVRGLADKIATQTPYGKTVAVLLPNGPASLIGIMACLAAGRCCLVLDADHPAERNARILADADVHTIIVKSDACPVISLLPDGLARIIVGDPDGAASRPASSWWRPTPVGPDELAIILYTSGSTGQPKGIALSQAAILARIRNCVLSIHLNPSDRCLPLSALGTTAGLVASLSALLAGSLQYVLSVSASGAGTLLSLIREERVTHLWGVPALLRLLFETDGAGEALHSLRVIRTFGDRLLKSDLQRWRAVLPDSAHLGITYGQTEAIVAQWFVPNDFTSDDATVPTGYLLPEYEYAVVDETGRPVGAGEVGELILRSRYVALGVWAQGRCTLGRMRADRSTPLLRILDTGDLVRIRPDGLLHIVGRLDRQVKIRGHRVEPAEIEDVLRQVAGVVDSVIAVRRNAEETTLLAFVTAADPGDAALAERARRAISLTLPTYMQPARLLVVDRFPLLPGGKVDETALLAIGAATPLEQRNANPVASPTARREVARAWRRVLDRSSLDADLPFDEAGGDSLRLLRFVFHLEEQRRLTLPLEVFRAELRPSEFAQALDAILRPTPIAQGSAPVLFLLPGTSKDGPRLARFRTACTPALHMVLLDYGDWPEWCASNFDFTTLLARLIRDIEDQAPDGPILLAGYSLGGIVAHALAAALSASGRSIGFLGILDSDITPPDEALVYGTGRFLRRKLADLVDLMWRGEVTDALAWIIAYSLTRPGRRPMLRLVARFRHLPLPGALGFHLHRRLLMTVLLQLVAARRVETVSAARLPCVPAALFRSEGHAADARDDLGWQHYYPDIAVVPVRGDHHTMLDQANLEILCRAFVAAALRACDEAERGSDRGPAFGR